MEVNSFLLYKALLGIYRKSVRSSDGELNVPDRIDQSWEYMASTARELSVGINKIRDKEITNFSGYLTRTVALFHKELNSETIHSSRLDFIKRLLNELEEHSKSYPKVFWYAYQQGLKEGGV